MKKKRSANKGLYRDGKQLVIREGTTFPERCTICNKTDDVEPVEFTFAREKLRYVELAAIQTVARAATDLAKGAKYTGPVQAEISLCASHRGRRLRLFGIGVGMTALAIAFLVIENAMGAVIVPPGELGFLDIAIYNWAAFGMAFTGIVFILMCVFDSSKLWFKPTNYFDRFVWVTGAGPAFLAELPPIEKNYLKALDGHGNITTDEANLTAEELIRRAGLEDE